LSVTSAYTPNTIFIDKITNETLLFLKTSINVVVFQIQICLCFPKWDFIESLCILLVHICRLCLLHSYVDWLLELYWNLNFYLRSMV